MKNEEIASYVRKLSDHTPALPSITSPTYLDYLLLRIDEVITIWRLVGLEPEHLNVMASAALIEKFSKLSTFQGLTIDFIINPLSDLSEDTLDEGTFSLEFISPNPASLWIAPAIGIAYPGGVSPKQHQIRWVLQVIDGMDPRDAAKASQML